MAAKGLALGLTVGMALSMAGCGTPGAPLPPSLNLPDKITNLAAKRTGNRVSLTWTTPRRNTDKLLLKGAVEVQVCREEKAGNCVLTGGLMPFSPASPGTFTETLPPELASGAPRLLSYFVELKNRAGRSSGRSNAAAVLAGSAPGAVNGLHAEVRKEGVVLHWANGSGQDSAGERVRLHRTLLTPTSQAKNASGPLAAAPESVEQVLLVAACVSGAAKVGCGGLDKAVLFGNSYAYRAQRVISIAIEGQEVELDGEFSEPVKVAVLDVFPPDVPTGLAAVASGAEAGNKASIDLSWQPNTEADLAGYAVYRREALGAWQRISKELIQGPAYRDLDVEPGHRYSYAVTVLDQGGHESARSVEAEETAPTP